MKKTKTPPDPNADLIGRAWGPKSKTKAVLEIDFKISSIWMEIRTLRKDIQKSTDYVDLLFKNLQLPLVAGDIPTREWTGILSRMIAIGELLDVRRKLVHR